jgi:hypothetical protein
LKKIAMDKHAKAEIVKAITLLQREAPRIDETLQILCGLVGLVSPPTRRQKISPAEASGHMNVAQRAEIGFGATGNQAK